MFLTPYLFCIWLIAIAGANQRHDQETNQPVDNDTLSRDRRLIVGPGYLWPKGIIPFSFEPSVVGNLKAETLRLIAFVEDQSCIRFYPRTEELYVKNGLLHRAQVSFYTGSGCLSGVGFGHSGVRTSSCEAEAGLHEIGHAIGFRHEQESTGSIGWIDVLLDNIPPNWKGFYKATNNGDHRGYYDISTIMQYKQLYYYRDRPVFAKDFPELPVADQWFYFFREMAKAYRCQKFPQCQNRPLGCQNDGYQTIQHGECRCICPAGLDPDNHCKTPLKKVKKVSWPKGQYSLLKPKTGCPPGFKEGQLFESGAEGNLMSPDSQMAGKLEGIELQLEFCTRTEKDDTFQSDEEEKFNWPVGSFCIFQAGGKCAKGFVHKTLNYTVDSHESKGFLPDVHQGRWDFCCQYKGFSKEPARFPVEKPFALIKWPYQRCQEVEGMRLSEETLTIGSNSFTRVDDPFGQWIGHGSTFNVPVCHYTPMDMNCGDTFILGNNNREVTIEMTGSGRKDLGCTWFIKGDNSKGTMVLDFEKFAVGPATQTTNCADKVVVRHALIGQDGLTYCGKIGHSIRSITDKMMMKFFTKGDSKSSFKARVKWIPFDDMCYDVAKRGVNYDGNVNYTRVFQPCLPWADLDQCTHNPYVGNKVEGSAPLTGNACRNPDNSFRPWCYTDKTGCQRNYCDVCGLEIPHDSMDNCLKLKQEGLCTRDNAEAVKYCAATCFDQLTTKPLTTKHTEVTCPKPRGFTQDVEKASYVPGEIITYQFTGCPGSSSKVTRRCLTSGQWSEINIGCKGRGSTECYDRINEETCLELIKDRPTVCHDLPAFANTSCPYSCGVCRTNTIMCPIANNLNPNVKVVTKDSNHSPSIKVGETVTYRCADFKYPANGDATRSCLPNGMLSGKPLECGDCPVGYILVDNECHGLILGQPLTYKDAKAKCNKLGGFLATPKTQAENNIVAKVEAGAPIWLGANDLYKEGVFEWDDGSNFFWSNWAAGEPKADGHNQDCVMMNENHKWVNIRCDEQKLLAVCTISKSDDDTCYDMKDGGTSYDGTVNYTRKFEPCLPWTSVTHCPHHAYKPGNEQANLVGNACRNPDQSYRPWCYTDVKGCKMNYCDVCGNESPKDKRNDCILFKAKGLCTRDAVKALKDCAATCLESLPNRKPVIEYPKIECGPPTPPSDGTFVGTAKKNYKLGAIVEYKCKRAPWSVFAKCMTSGQWSQTGYACPPCSLDYTLRGNKCFKAVTESAPYKYASDNCAKTGAHIAVPDSLAETKFYASLVHSSMWLGFTDEKKEGTWVTADGKKPAWIKWNPGRPIVDHGVNCAEWFYEGDTTLDGSCNMRFPYICEAPTLKREACEDYMVDQCPQLLSQEPEMCLKHPEFAERNCAKTCGFCGTKTTCSKGTPSPNVLVVNPRPVKTGEYVKFTCSSVTYPTDGDSIRACLPNGELTGKPLRCGDCPAGFKLVANTCLGLVEGKTVTHQEAKDECKRLGGFIAMPKSLAENDAIVELGGNHPWIGAMKTNDGGFKWEDGDTMNWNNWHKDFYESDGKKGNCAFMGESKQWMSIECGTKLVAVCGIPLKGKKCDVAYHGNCYNVIANAQPMTYDDGSAVCDRMGGTMVAPRNPQENSLVASIMRGYKTGNTIWLGINDKVKEGMWTYQNGDVLEWVNWNQDEPNNFGENGESCGTMQTNTGHWNDIMCDRKYPVVCAVEKFLPPSSIQCNAPRPPMDSTMTSFPKDKYFVEDVVEYTCKRNHHKVYSRCMSNHQWSDSGFACLDCPGTYYNGNCYKAFNDQLGTYDQAVSYCQHEGGYDLVAPKSQEEAAFVSSLIKKSNLVWIGITDRKQENKWRYEDGTDVTWTNWNPSEPNNSGKGEDCVGMTNQQRWIDVPCSYLLKEFVCIKKIDHI